MQTLVFAAEKGGCGKTSSAVCAAYAFAQEGKQCLFVDLDAHTTATMILLSGKKTDKTIRTVLTGKCKQPEQALCPCEIGYIMPSDAFLSESDIETVQAVKTILSALQTRFDVCIIDTPPALSIISLSALTAADYAIIPSKTDLVGIVATKATMDTVKTIQERTNHALRVGVLPTGYNGRTTLHQAYYDGLKDVATAYGARTFSPIRTGIALQESQALHKSLFSYAPRAGVTQDYKTFYNELKEEITANGKKI